jgi:hypothetical protein
MPKLSVPDLERVWLPKRAFALDLEQNLVRLFDTGYWLRPQVCFCCLISSCVLPVRRFSEEGMMSMALLDRVVWVDPDSVRVRCCGCQILIRHGTWLPKEAFHA